MDDLIFRKGLVESWSEEEKARFLALDIVDRINLVLEGLTHEALTRFDEDLSDELVMQCEVPLIKLRNQIVEQRQREQDQKSEAGGNGNGGNGRTPRNRKEED